MSKQSLTTERMRVADLPIGHSIAHHGLCITHTAVDRWRCGDERL
jgi:riboflavin synthase alpha subunit